jgi:hypothetical protein
MNIYLDIDGVLLTKQGVLVAGAPDFIKNITNKYNVYWLTTWCKDGSSDKVLEILKKCFPVESIKYLEKIKPSIWKTWKTEAIDFTQNFRWIDDLISPEEEKVLAKNKAKHKVLIVPDDLQGFIDNIDIYIPTDELIEEAIKLVLKYNRATTTLFKIKLNMGYARAAYLLEMLEDMGIVGPADGSKPRKVNKPQK